MAQAPVLGIDFGTTNTTAAWIDPAGQLRFVDVRDGVRTLPTAVWYDGKGGVLVGAAAREQALDEPRDTVFGWKRFLGRRYASDFVHRHKDRFSYAVVEAKDGSAAVHVRGAVRPLEEPTFHVVNRIVELANAAAGKGFELCVLTVPAHFGYRQRASLRKAAEMAGLEVKAMINEPTAAALCFLQTTGVEDTFLVFDLGGGTFDATLVSVKRGLIEILATSGDAFLGGADFDARLVDLLVDRYAAEKGVDLRTDPIVMQRLAFAAERAKIELSAAERARVVVRGASVSGGAFADLAYDVTRRELETATAPLVEKCLGICEDLLVRAGRKSDTVAGLLFVGGQTRMPALRRRLVEKFRFDPDRQPDPEMAVCAGAAILGRGLHVMVDVVPMSLGVMLAGGVTQEIIAPSSVVPCVRRLPLARPANAAHPIFAAFYEATSSTATERDLVGTVRIEADWLKQHAGDVTLEVRMGREFDLQLIAHCAGVRLPLELQAPLSG